VRRLPACSQPAFDISVSSAEIDAEVRRRLHAGEPLYSIDSELIRELQPDLIVTQSHCDVCAVTPADLKRDGCTLAPRQLSLAPSTIEGIFQSIQDVAGTPFYIAPEQIQGKPVDGSQASMSQHRRLHLSRCISGQQTRGHCPIMLQCYKDESVASRFSTTLQANALFLHAFV